MLSRFGEIHPVYRFLTLFGLLSLIWYFLYTYLLQPYTSLDESTIRLTTWFSSGILDALGHTTFVNGRELRIAGTSGLWIGDNCNAVVLFALFTGFIISFPGDLRSKTWYIPLGLAVIFILNCIRMAALAIIDTYSREWTEFNHTYTFTIVIYGAIFYMWMIWVNNFSEVKKLKNE